MPDPGYPYYDEVMALLQAGANVSVLVFEVAVAAGWDQATTTADAQALFAAFDWGGSDPGAPPHWIQRLPEVAASFSITATGLLIKRSYGADPPANRNHMHPVDASIQDSWYLTPGATVVVRCGDATASSGARRNATAYAGQSDAQIGDLLLGDPHLQFGMHRYAGWPMVGHDLAAITVAGLDLSGLERSFDATTWGGGPVGEEYGFRAYGSSETLTGRCIGSPTGDWSDFTGYLAPPLQFAWDATCGLFERLSGLDPTVRGGFLDSAAQDAAYALSELPSGPALPLSDTSGTVYDPAPRHDIHPSATFALSIDEEWALKTWVCPTAVASLDESEVSFDDRYLTLYAPGVNAGVEGGTQPVGGVSGVEKSALPLAPGLTGDPDLRWNCTGDVTESTNSTRTEPAFTVAAAGEGTAAYTPITRLWDRLALCSQTESGNPPTPVPKDWAWPWHLKAAAYAEDLASFDEQTQTWDPREPAYAEDVFHFGGSSYLRLKLTRPGGYPLPALTLVLEYSTITVSDPHYTCGGLRAEEWSYTRSTGLVTYSIPLELDQETVHIDLLCPDEGTLPRLYVVDQVRLEGLANPADEAVDLVVEEFALEDDPGSDHTGRQAQPQPRTLASVKTTWDFLADWQGLSLARDGNHRVLEWPGDPWSKSGPEQGRGYVEPLQHCPTNPNTGLLHYARPIADLAAARYVEGLAAEVDASDLTDAPGAGGVNESLGTALMYWGANQPWLVPGRQDEPGLPLPASVHVRSQSLARGIPYTLCLRKALGGAAWGLVRSPDGRRRVIRDSVAAHSSEWVIWSRVTAYLDQSGNPITAPAGCPALDEWLQTESGGLWERLDQHGLFITPGLKPSRTRVWNTARGTNPADHTDTADIEYLLQFWCDAGAPWAAYDLNDPASYAEMLADERLVVNRPFTVAVRRLTALDLSGLPANSPPLGRDDYCWQPPDPAIGELTYSPHEGGLCRGAADRGGSGPGNTLRPRPHVGVVWHAPGADLAVQDPRYAVNFRRVWRNDWALFNESSPGLARGWKHNWDIVIADTGEPATWPDLELRLPLGATIRLAVDLAGGAPTGSFVVETGWPCVVTGVPAATPGQWTSLTVVWSCSTIWHFAYHSSDTYAIIKRQDSAGGHLAFAWDNNRRLTAVTADDSNTVLDFTYDGNGQLGGLEDWYGRRVAYTFAAVEECAPTLVAVSSLYEGPTAPAAPRWSYSYQQYPELAPQTGVFLLLRTLTSLGPEDGETSTARLAYYEDSYRLAYLTDAREAEKIYVYGGTDQVVAKIAGAADEPVGVWRLDFAANQMLTDSGYPGSPDYLYEDEHNPRKPTTLIDADGSITTTTYNLRGQPTSVSDALGNVTTYTYEVCSQGIGQLKTQVRGAVTLISNTYDPGGRLVRTQDALGYLTSYAYDNRDNRIATTNPLGAITTAGYDAHDRVVSRTNPLGHSWVYGYDRYSRQHSQTDPLGHVTTYLYDLADDQVLRVNPLHHVWTSTYGPGGHHLQETNPLGQTHSFAYDPEGHLRAERTPLGFRTSYTHNAYGQVRSTTDPLGYLNQTVYDGYGRAIASVDPNNYRTLTRFDQYSRVHEVEDALHHVTTTTYDAHSRPVGQTDALGNTATTVYDHLSRTIAQVTPLGYRTTTAYDDLDRPVASIDAVGGVRTTIYDPAGRSIAALDTRGYRSTTVYDPANQAIAQVDALGYRSTAVYDAAGQRTASQNALGLISETVYDAAGAVIAQIAPHGGRTTATYDAAGRNVATTDPLGRATTQLYDDDGRVVASIDPLGYRTSTIYNAGSESVATVDALGARTTTTNLAAGQQRVLVDPVGTTTTTTYDALYRPITTTDHLGGTTVSTPDARGRSIALQDANNHLSSTTYDADGRQVASVQPQGETTGFAYDGLGRSTATTNAEQHTFTTHYESDGRVAAADPAGYRTTQYYDPLGRLLAAEDAAGCRTTHLYDALGRTAATQNAEGHVFTNIYDDLGWWSAAIDPRGARTTTVYDLAGQQVGTQDPLGQWTLYTYDGRGQLATRTDGRGWVTTYLYDPVGREIQRIYPNDARVTSTYDPAGRVLAVRDESGISSFTLDPLGRRSSVDDPSGVTLRYTYDPVGNRLTLRDQAGGRTTYTYNANDQLEHLVNPCAETTTWTWDRLGRVAEQTLANGVRASHTYNSRGQASSLRQLRPDGVVFAAYTATYDAVGNRTQVDEIEGTWYYGYDRTQQLTSEQRTGSYAYHTTYTYDAVGNRLLMERQTGQVTTYVYDLADQVRQSESNAAVGDQSATVCALRELTAGPYSQAAVAMSHELSADEFRVEQTSIAVVGAAGTWDAANCWLFSLLAGDGSLGSVTTLATATYEQAGAGIVRLPVPVPDREVDGATAPLLAVRGEPLGQPPNLLRVTGSVALQQQVGGAWVPAGGAAPELPPLLPAPYSGDALALLLPLSAGASYRLTGATVRVVGATGTWDASNKWTVALQTRAADWTVLETLATGTVTAAGAHQVILALPAPVEVEADTKPLLAIAFERVGNPGLLLRASGTATFDGSGEAGITSISYDQNGNTLSESRPGGLTSYTWDAEDRLVAVETLTGLETYTYAADGLRRRKVTGEGTAQFVWDGQNLLAELDGAGSTTVHNTDFPGHWGGLSSRRTAGAVGGAGTAAGGDGGRGAAGAGWAWAASGASRRGRPVALDGGQAARAGVAVAAWRGLAARRLARGGAAGWRANRSAAELSTPVGQAPRRRRRRRCRHAIRPPRRTRR
ncbi:MAG: RHS repeat protein [Fimbriimonadaceae bacterium]|nr:RHS repeat protein [Fimbriimonadaceae bacterium]